MTLKKYVYIINEKDWPGMPAQTDYLKIGIYKESRNGSYPAYDRERALNQGNPRGVVILREWELNELAYLVEQIVHRKMRKLYKSRLEETNMTGHSEWFNVTFEQAVEIIQDVIENQLAHKNYLNGLEILNDELFDTLFSMD